MDGWVDGVDEYMHSCMSGWNDGCICGWMAGIVHACRDGLMDVSCTYM